MISGKNIVMAQVRYPIAVLLIWSGLQVSAQIPSNPQEEEVVTQGDPMHAPGSGATLVLTDKVRVDFAAFASMRYLNQQGLDDIYINSAGDTSHIDKRNDLQFQKLMLYFKGWLGTPKFRYVFYSWTSNTSQGQGARLCWAETFNIN